MKIKKRFVCKKNHVILVEDNHKEIVYKKFNNKDYYEREKGWYIEFESLKINVPKLLNYKDEEKILIIEYLRGKTLLETLEEAEIENNKEKACKLLWKLYEWLNNFYNLKVIKKESLVFYDMNFRNFIIIDDDIYGVDFETIEKGLKVEDFSRIVGMYLLYDPKHSEFKKSVVHTFMNHIRKIENYHLHDFNKYLENEMNIIIERRSKKSFYKE